MDERARDARLPAAREAERRGVTHGGFARVEHDAGVARETRRRERLREQGFGERRRVADGMGREARIAVVGSESFAHARIPPMKAVGRTQEPARDGGPEFGRQPRDAEERCDRHAARDLVSLRDPGAEQAADGESHDRDAFAEFATRRDRVVRERAELGRRQIGEGGRHAVGVSVMRESRDQHVRTAVEQERAERAELTRRRRESVEQDERALGARAVTQEDRIVGDRRRHRAVRNAFAVAVGLLGARVFWRMLATSASDGVRVVDEARPGGARVGVVVPVLDEAARLEPCLAGLCAQPATLAEIVVVDGGSRDGTRELVRAFAARDPRVRLVDAAPVPADWNGKAWNLACGLAASDPELPWIACVDADVRPQPYLATSLVAHAEESYLDAFSAAPLLELSGPLEAALHPSFLATLVYRLGIPGHVAHDARSVQANGQCFVARRGALVATRAFAAARASRCDDATIARRLFAAGYRVGFFEGGRLSRVAMYASGVECWRNWPRSLALRDASTPLAESALACAEVAFVQALPLAFVVVTLATRATRDDALFSLCAIFAVARLVVLGATRRAYAPVAWTYWLSPLLDVPALVRIVVATLDRAPTWRGRALVPETARA